MQRVGRRRHNVGDMDTLNDLVKRRAAGAHSALDFTGARTGGIQALIYRLPLSGVRNLARLG